MFDELDRYHGDALPRVFKKPRGLTRSQQFVLEIMADPSAALFVAEEKGTLIGFVHVCVCESRSLPFLVPRRYARIDSLEVRKGYRGAGVGKRLVERAHRWAGDEGAEQVELTVWEFNQAAIAMYEKLGYETANRRMRLALKTATT